jgi:hypothetical protein
MSPTPVSRDTRSRATEAFAHLAGTAERAAVVAGTADPDVLLDELLQLRALMDACTASTVRAARDAGTSWTEIGLALGMDPDEARQGFDDLELMAR